MTSRTADETRRTAIHEAGHAVLLIVLGLGCERVTIVRNAHEGEEGHAAHGGEWGRPAGDFGEEDDETATLRNVAEDAFWLRHASHYYAGAEAERLSRAQRIGPLAQTRTIARPQTRSIASHPMSGR